MSEYDKNHAICFIRESELTDDEIKFYYPLLSAKKQNEISLLNSASDRRVALCAEIAARRALSALNSVPNDRVYFSCGSDGKYVCDRNTGFLDVKTVNGVCVAAATAYPAGLGIAPIKSFQFADAQQMLSDSEIRSVVASAGCSLMDIVNNGKCSSRVASELYAKFCALKSAVNSCLPMKEQIPPRKLSFSFSCGEFAMSDGGFSVEYCGADKNTMCAAAVVIKN